MVVSGLVQPEQNFTRPSRRNVPHRLAFVSHRPERVRPTFVNPDAAYLCGLESRVSQPYTGIRGTNRRATPQCQLDQGSVSLVAKLMMIFLMLASCESHNRPRLPAVGQVLAAGALRLAILPGYVRGAWIGFEFERALRFYGII